MRTDFSEFTFRFAEGDRDFSFLDKVKTTETHIHGTVPFVMVLLYFSRDKADGTRSLPITSIK